VINKSREEAGHFYTENKTASHDELNASKLGYQVAHTMDLYDEVSTSEGQSSNWSIQVATIARPPVDPAHKRPTTEYTGYIICIYQVFKGDDGEKFERNWLYWTGVAGPGQQPLLVEAD
jgi:hypothetical protein